MLDRTGPPVTRRRRRKRKSMSARGDIGSERLRTEYRKCNSVGVRDTGLTDQQQHSTGGNLVTG